MIGGRKKKEIKDNSEKRCLVEERKASYPEKSNVPMLRYLNGKCLKQHGHFQPFKNDEVR